MNNNSPVFELDPQAQRMVSSLETVAAAIRGGAPVGAILILLDHQLGGATMEVYQPGDAYRCYGLLHALANGLVAQTKNQKSRLLIPG